MLRIIQSTSSAAAKSYYAEGLSKEDYYSQGQEIIGEWQGRAARMLGLVGQVDKPSFDRLCDNLHPATGDKLTARTKKNRRIGYDINFHAPKSVSLVQAVAGEQRIVAAFREAVRETMAEMETGLEVRVRKGGAFENRTSGNWAYGEFIHFTARPVKGALDPHLHSHCFTFNASWDRQEQAWKAGDFAAIKRDAPYFEAAFHARMAGKLAAMGFSVERTAKGWEIAGIERATIEKFSQRTELIEKLAKKLGVKTDQLKDTLGAKTRERKHKGLTESQLREEWLARMTPEERRAVFDSIRSADGKPAPKPVNDRQAVDYALAHGFARASVLGEKELLAEALRYGVGSVTVEGIKAELETRIKSGDIIAAGAIGSREMTTRVVLTEEKAMIDFAKKGRGKYAALGKASYQVKRGFLNDEQKAAVRHILRSNDRVIALRGGAGTGKTTLMQEAIAGMEESGQKVFTFAPSANASRGVLRAEGFQSAETVAVLLDNSELHAQIKGNVIWIDEAGMVSSRTMRQVFALAERLDARVILSGDVRQHASPDRGDALRILEDNGAVKRVELNTIQRQKGDYKKAVEAIAGGDVEKGFDQLDRLGAIVESESEQRYQTLAREYLQAVKESKTALVVSPTHKEGELVNQTIRDELRRAGKLGQEEKSVVHFKNLQWTDAQKGHADNYQPGQVIEFHRAGQGVQRGERLTIAGRSEFGQVIATNHRGQHIAVPLQDAGKFSVFEQSTLALRQGDKIRITQNGAARVEADKPRADSKAGKPRCRLNNGAFYQVAGFTPAGDIKLNNGWIIGKDYGHLAYGYCTTSPGAQGSTVDRVFLAQDSRAGLAASREQFYVSISRGRESVKIFCEDKAALKQSVLESRARQSATELVKKAAGAVEKKKSTLPQKMVMQFIRMKELAKIYASRAMNTKTDGPAKPGRSHEARTR